MRIFSKILNTFKLSTRLSICSSPKCVFPETFGLRGHTTTNHQHFRPRQESPYRPRLVETRNFPMSPSSSFYRNYSQSGKLAESVAGQTTSIFNKNISNVLPVALVNLDKYENSMKILFIPLNIFDDRTSLKNDPLSTISVIREHAKQVEAITENLMENCPLDVMETKPNEMNDPNSPSTVQTSNIIDYIVTTSTNTNAINPSSIKVVTNSATVVDLDENIEKPSTDNVLTVLDDSEYQDHLNMYNNVENSLQLRDNLQMVPANSFNVEDWNASKDSLFTEVSKGIESQLSQMAVSSVQLGFEMDMTNIKEAIEHSAEVESMEIFNQPNPKLLKNPTLGLTTNFDLENIHPNQTIPLNFNALIQGVISIDPSKINLEKLSQLQVAQFNDNVTAIAANICSAALQKGFPTDMFRTYSSKKGESKPRNPHITCVREGEKGCVSPGNSENRSYSSTGGDAPAVDSSSVFSPSSGSRALWGLMNCNVYAKALAEAAQRRKSIDDCQPCEDITKAATADLCNKLKEDPCQPQKQEAKNDSCNKKKDDPCKPKKKKDTCKKKKEDTCNKKKEDPCKPKKKEDTCKKKKADPCKPKKKEDSCKKKEADPCKPKKKEDSCKKKEADPCKPKKKADTCKSKKADPCGKGDSGKKKSGPCKKEEKKTSPQCKKAADKGASGSCGAKKKADPCGAKKADAKKSGGPCKKEMKKTSPQCNKGGDKGGSGSCGAKKKADPCGAKKADAKKSGGPCKKEEKKTSPQCKKAEAKGASGSCGAKKKADPCGAKKADAKKSGGPCKKEMKKTSPQCNKGGDKGGSGSCGAKKKADPCGAKKADAKKSGGPCKKEMKKTNPQCKKAEAKGASGSCGAKKKADPCGAKKADAKKSGGPCKKEMKKTNPQCNKGGDKAASGSGSCGAKKKADPCGAKKADAKKSGGPCKKEMKKTNPQCNKGGDKAASGSGSCGAKKKADPCGAKKADAKKSGGPCKKEMKKTNPQCNKGGDKAASGSGSCGAKKKADPCKSSKKASPCKSKKADPCKSKKSADPCKSKKADPCKKKANAKCKTEDPCKSLEKEAKKGACNKPTKPTKPKCGGGSDKKFSTLAFVPNLTNIFPHRQYHTTMSTWKTKLELRVLSLSCIRSFADKGSSGKCIEGRPVIPKKRKTIRRKDGADCFKNDDNPCGKKLCKEPNCKKQKKKEKKCKKQNKYSQKGSYCTTFSKNNYQIPCRNFSGPIRMFSSKVVECCNKENKCEDPDPCEESNDECENEAVKVVDVCKLTKVSETMPMFSEYDVLIKTDSVAISGSDIHLYETGGKLCPTMTLGHDASGTVQKVGRCITNLKPGDRVAMESGLSCGICDFCKRGAYNMCAQLLYNGFLTKYQVHPADLCHKIPESVSLEEATLTQTLALGCQACFKTHITPLTRLLIMGSSPTAIAAALCARSMGVHSICVVCNMHKNLEQMRKCFDFDYVYYDCDTSHRQILDAIWAKLNNWPEVVINCSVSEQTMNIAVMALQPCGTCVLAECESECATFNAIDVLMKNLRLVPSFRFTNMFPTALHLMSTGKAQMCCMVRKIFGWNQIQTAFDTAQHEANIGYKKVIVKCSEENC
ncbi:uncharacterized protein LOC119677906 isoform X1 [Teleopsis dalmanni]|uniref:uncharacterized protein LOC119677906 isoform X1 n=1 Tax=Teleopsis dalmanni TaxID=139649 RepID=UPI0018CF1DE8|nr:uncharacterized protein LOC119677906 isoform X1 [Teleopsis dalmanni]